MTYYDAAPIMCRLCNGSCVLKNNCPTLWCFFLPVKGIHCSFKSWRLVSRVLTTTQTSSRTRSITAGVSLALHPDYMLCSEMRVDYFCHSAEWDLNYYKLLFLHDAEPRQVGSQPQLWGTEVCLTPCKWRLTLWNSKGFKTRKLPCMTPGMKFRFPC